MYNQIVSKATRIATLSLKGKSYPITMTGDFDLKVDNKQVANGSRTKGYVSGLASWSVIMVSAPYDKAIGPEMFNQAVALKGTDSAILTISNDTEDDNPITAKCKILSVKQSGMNADSNEEARVEIELAPLSVNYAKTSNSTQGQRGTKAQGEVTGSDEVASESTALTQAINPGNGVSFSVAGIPVSISI